MSTNFTDEFVKSPPPISDIAEESWEGTLRPPSPRRHRHHGEESEVHSRFHIGEETKKYRLVYNTRAEAVRLEPQQAQAAEATPATDEQALGDRIAEVIEASRRILALEDDWDEEGSPGYEETTWRRATNFIKEAAISYQENYGDLTVAPRILPGPDGSIDVHWKTPTREVLINIPANEETPAGYYGSSSSNVTIKGKLDPSVRNLWLLLWLLQ